MTVEDENSIIMSNNGEYGVPIRDGGDSYLIIKYCPWCGRKIRKDSSEEK